MTGVITTGRATLVDLLNVVRTTSSTTARSVQGVGSIVDTLAHQAEAWNAKVTLGIERDKERAIIRHNATKDIEHHSSMLELQDQLNKNPRLMALYVADLARRGETYDPVNGIKVAPIDPDAPKNTQEQTETES